MLFHKLVIDTIDHGLPAGSENYGMIWRPSSFRPLFLRLIRPTSNPSIGGEGRASLVSDAILTACHALRPRQPPAPKTASVQVGAAITNCY